MGPQGQTGLHRCPAEPAAPSAPPAEQVNGIPTVFAADQVAPQDNLLQVVYDKGPVAVSGSLYSQSCPHVTTAAARSGRWLGQSSRKVRQSPVRWPGVGAAAAVVPRVPARPCHQCWDQRAEMAVKLLQLTPYTRLTPT